MVSSTALVNLPSQLDDVAHLTLYILLFSFLFSWRRECLFRVCITPTAAPVLCSSLSYEVLRCDVINRELRFVAVWKGFWLPRGWLSTQCPVSRGCLLHRKSDPFTQATRLRSHPPSTTFKINTQELFTTVKLYILNTVYFTWNQKLFIDYKIWDMHLVKNVKHHLHSYSYLV